MSKSVCAQPLALRDHKSEVCSTAELAMHASPCCHPSKGCSGATHALSLAGNSRVALAGFQPPASPLKPAAWNFAAPRGCPCTPAHATNSEQAFQHIDILPPLARQYMDGACRLLSTGVAIQAGGLELCGASRLPMHAGAALRGRGRAAALRRGRPRLRRSAAAKGRHICHSRRCRWDNYLLCRLHLYFWSTKRGQEISEIMLAAGIMVGLNTGIPNKQFQTA